MRAICIYHPVTASKYSLQVCPQTSAFYVVVLELETKFHNRIK